MKVESEPSTRGFNQLNNEAGDIYNEEDQLLEELESMIVEARVTDRPTLLLLTVVDSTSLSLSHRCICNISYVTYPDIPGRSTKA